MFGTFSQQSSGLRRSPDEIRQDIHNTELLNKLTPIERWVLFGLALDSFHSTFAIVSGSRRERVVNNDPYVHEVLNVGRVLLQPEESQIMNSKYHINSIDLLSWPYPSLASRVSPSFGYCLPMVYNGSLGAISLKNYDWVDKAYVFGIGFLVLDHNEMHAEPISRVSTSFHGTDFQIPVLQLKYVVDNRDFVFFDEE